MSQRSAPARLIRAVRGLWRSRRLYGRRRDWLARWYNGLINRSPRMPWPGRGGIWPVRIAGVEEPFFVRQGSKDWVALREIWFQGEYDAVIAARLEGIRTVLDLGANIGMSVRLWLRELPGVRVVAVEPDPGNLEICRRAVAAAGAERDVRLIGAAVAGTPGRGLLDRTGGNALVYQLVGHQPGADTVEVETVTVGQILDVELPGVTVDLLKCDVEGAESEVFADCGSWIGRVRHVVIEIHPEYSLDLLLRDLRVGGAAPTVLWRLAKGFGVELALLRLNFTDQCTSLDASPG